MQQTLRRILYQNIIILKHYPLYILYTTYYIYTLHIHVIYKYAKKHILMDLEIVHRNN